MPLINHAASDANWLEVLVLWEQVANWARFRPSEAVLRQQVKALVVFLSNEKDWLKQQYPSDPESIERTINNSKYIGIIVDLANLIKHRRL